jgi:hypothetical protein
MKTSMLILAALVSLLSARFVKAASDIAITQTINKRFFNVGDTLKLTIHITNKGPDASGEVDMYPQNDALDELSELGAQCWSGPVGVVPGPSPDGDVCEFAIGSFIPAGQTYNETVQYRVNGTSSSHPPDDYIANCYEFNFDYVVTTDPAPANDCAISVFRLPRN